MRSGVALCALAVSFFSLPHLTAVDAAPPPSAPNAGLAAIAAAAATSTAATAAPTIPAAFDRPVRLRIPSINLDDRIIPVGINDKGEMDVPDGKTNDVGWYRYGPVPGEDGSAVLDAHVYAAFRNLNKVPVGADIYVTLESGAVKHFVVRQATVYRLATLSSDTLFDHGDGRWLNIITCAGKLTPDRSTYDRRLIVFAELVP